MTVMTDGRAAHESNMKAKVKESEVAQSCPTLWDPMDCSLPGSSIHGIFQARILEWVTISVYHDLKEQPRSSIHH